MCIQYTVEGAVSIVSSHSFDDSLIKQMQEWGGGVEQLLSYNVRVGETSIPLLPWAIVKDKEEFKC